MRNVRAKKFHKRKRLKIHILFVRPNCIGIFIAFMVKNLDTFYSESNQYWIQNTQ
jgi:hypothetical protein